jgi:serine/threonine-protein kinase PknG
MGSRLLARPPLPPLDPLAAVVPGEVPIRKRFCSGCESPLKRDSGFCPKCGQEYSFKPTLEPGNTVAAKYEIKGTIAFGGLGWIYLAVDTVLNRWVILKGLLNSKDPRMLEVAVQEREYLAAVKHPNIVGIYDFVTHGSEGFIAMEYVNGKTLMTLRKEKGGPLPVAEACSYIAEILPALGYLDEMGMVYCDFKPENVMVEEETVKLIDMGAVRQVGAVSGDIYGSKGYTAPEAHDAPTPVSDLYSAARALAVLVANFDFQGKYESSLPPREEVDVFVQHEPLYRFLLKATRPKVEERFQTAAEMQEQLIGVLHAIVGESAELGRFESALFEGDSDRLETDSHSHRQDGLPRIRVDKEDTAAGLIMAAGAVTDPQKRLAMFERGLKTAPDSLELKMRTVDELVSVARFADAEERLGALQKEHPNDWRLAWYRGRWLLAQGKTKETIAAFEAIMGELPGEVAPQQALGRAYEEEGTLERAIAYYDAVSRADPSLTSAALGLARCLEKKKDKTHAVGAYRRVPAGSSRYAQAQMALVKLLVSDLAGEPSRTEIEQAAVALEGLEGLVDGIEIHKLRAAFYVAAANHVTSAGWTKKDGEQLVGVEPRAGELRAAAEKELRTCARFAGTEAERYDLVDEANRVRPLTLL